MRRGVLIISASMGAGHDGAARELRKRLESRGHDVTVVDFLTMMPFKLGAFCRWTYETQLKTMPWSYELSYKALGFAAPVVWGPVVRLMSLLTRRAIKRELRETRPDAVVSTYPMASLVLGRMRKKKWLRVPVATYLTDFAVHPLWVHPGIDLHLAVSPVSAETAGKRGGHDNRASGPLVADRFRDKAADRDEMRRRLGIEHDERVVLVVAGSWGVGDVPKTLRSITDAGPYHPITVCGHDDKLRSALLEEGLGGTVLGWTDEMPALMATADALVENAGGLTAMEAFAAGLPVITFHPIAGHGKDNARYMSGSGVSRYAHDDAELREVLNSATTPGPERDEMVAAGRSLFAGDPTDDVLELAAATRADQLVVPFQTPKGRRRLTTIAACLAGLYLLLTIGAQGVAALGVGVAKPPKTATATVYLGVRVTAAELRTGSVVRQIEQMGATLVIDGRTAVLTGHRLETLADQGVHIGNGGWGQSHFLRWNRAHDDCRKAGQTIAQTAGIKAPSEFVPGRRLDGFDQFYCRTGKLKQRLVEPNLTFRPEDRVSPESRKVYLLDGRNRDPEAVAIALADFETRVEGNGLTIRPLEDLR
jgi:UDP-N-acetylglucosamine:LPS N-acetylglucosamine transferase